MARARKRPSSQSWHWPPSERRELYIGRMLSAAVELVISRAIEAGADSMSIEWRNALEEDIMRIMRDAWGNGAEKEADLRSALDGERLLRSRLESILRARGLTPPTNPIESEPPPPGDAHVSQDDFEDDR